jgi:hypothetical protein
LLRRANWEGGENDISTARRSLESRVTIDVQDAFEVREMRHRTFGLTIRREQIDRRRWRGTALRSLLTGIDHNVSETSD